MYNAPHLKPPCQEFVLHLQVVAFVHLSFEGLIEDGIARVVLDVLPASVAVTETRSSQGDKFYSTLLTLSKQDIISSSFI